MKLHLSLFSNLSILIIAAQTINSPIAVTQYDKLQSSTNRQADEVFDIYYSPKQAAEFIKVNSENKLVNGSRIKLYKYAFRGKSFTERVKKGEKPLGTFDDYQLIGTGSKEEVQQIGLWW